MQFQGAEIMAEQTIFQKVLINLIQDELTKLCSIEQGKAESGFHNVELSLAQKTGIKLLISKLSRIESNGSDKETTEAIVDEINKTRKDIQEIRTTEKANQEKGDAITYLTKLAVRTNDLYKKILELREKKPELYSFDLLDVTYKNNPLHMIYEFVIDYIGDDIFSPQNVDVDTRASKEQKVAERTRALTERIQPDANLEQHRTRALEMLRDLANDNKIVIKGEHSVFSSVLSKTTLWGFGLNLQLTGPGRLATKIYQTQTKITKLKEEEFEPLQATSLECTN